MSEPSLSFSSHLDLCAQGIPSGQQINAILEKQLKLLVRSELKRKNLLSQSPTLIGYDGDSWNDEEVLRTLLYDCYAHVFCRNLKSLLEGFHINGNSDGTIRLHVRNYLGDQQRQVNPIGCAVYSNLKAAVHLLLVEEVVAIEPIQRITGNTTIRLKDGECVERAILEELFSSDADWSAAFRKSVGESVETRRNLVKLIPRLPINGICAFRMGTLADIASSDLKAKIVEYQIEETQRTKKATKTTTANRTTELAIRYSTYEGESDVLTRLKTSTHLIKTTFKHKKVRQRMEKLVPYVVEILERGELVNWSLAAKMLGITRQRVYEDRERIRQLLSDDVEEQRDDK